MKSKILLIVLSIFVLIAAMGMAAMYKIGDKIIEKALEAEISDALSDINGNDTQIETTKEEIIETDPKGDTRKVTGDKPSVSKPSTLSESNKGTDVGGKAKGNQTLSLDGETEAVKDGMTPEKIKEIKDRVSAADKMTAATLVLKRLKQSDISELIKMLEGGITADEKERAKRLVYERFTADEAEEIKEIYRKYMYQ